MIHVVVDGSMQSIPKLLGKQDSAGSTVTAVDSQAGLVRTKNSVYRVVGPRSAEPDMQLPSLRLAEPTRCRPPLRCAWVFLLAEVHTSHPLAS